MDTRALPSVDSRKTGGSQDGMYDPALPHTSRPLVFLGTRPESVISGVVLQRRRSGPASTAWSPVLCRSPALVELNER